MIFPAAAAIDFGAWMRIAGISALSFAIVEIEKWMRRPEVAE